MGLKEVLDGLEKVTAPLCLGRVRASKQVVVRFDFNKAGGAGVVFGRCATGEALSCREVIDAELRDHVLLAL